MKVTYSERADALYVELSDKPFGRSEDASSGPDYERGIDYANDGDMLGVEFLNASRGVNLAGIPRADEIAAELRARGFTILEVAGVDHAG